MESHSLFDVHEGKPSWHQRKAGGTCAAITSGFKSRDAAQEHVDKMKKHHPEIRCWIVERATVVFDGKEFTANGFHIDVDAGRMIGYVSKAPEPLWNARGVSYWILSTWAGEYLAHLVWTGKSRSGWHGAEIHSYKTAQPIGGFYWYGRGSGEGMILKLRKGRKA